MIEDIWYNPKVYILRKNLEQLWLMEAIRDGFIFYTTAEFNEKWLARIGIIHVK